MSDSAAGADDDEQDQQSHGAGTERDVEAFRAPQPGPVLAAEPVPARDLLLQVAPNKKKRRRLANLEPLDEPAEPSADSSLPSGRPGAPSA